jgi:hypothetical protein
MLATGSDHSSLRRLALLCVCELLLSTSVARGGELPHRLVTPAPSGGEAAADPESDCDLHASPVRPQGSHAAALLRSTCERSPRFRALLRELATVPGLEIVLRAEPRGSPTLRGRGARGETRWQRLSGQVGDVDGVVRFTGAILCVVVWGPEAARVLGHELHHATEMVRWGDIRRAPTVRDSAGNPGSFETAAAVEAERAISLELRLPARAGGSGR